jgi:hypothetical protein
VIALGGPIVSHNGINFVLDPALDDEVYAEAASDSLGDVEFSFAADGWCRDVGCITVYPVEAYREEILFGADIVDGLASAIETRSDTYFPVLMAHILLRAQTRHIDFHNGSGIRAVVMKGQNTVFANNESIHYEFHGLSDDGQSYISVVFPIDAPILLSAVDPAQNTNAAAIPVPELPEDPVQLGEVMRTYNQEAERKLETLAGSSFRPDLSLLDGLVASLLVAPPPEPPAVAGNVGHLEADIDYVGSWYRETFSYTRRAENIAHFVLVMPQSQVDRATAGQVFSSLNFPAEPGVLSVREGREEFAWALEYLHQAPGGYFRGEFEPGVYYVAAAFVAAPISREEAGHPEDAILYAGITGGGASTDYERFAIEPGQNFFQFRLTDADGWACPWLYVYDGRSFERRTEILRNARGRRNEGTEQTPIGPVEVVDGAITLRVAEEKDEISFIDELTIVVDGLALRAESDDCPAARVAARDGDYLTIAAGESCTFHLGLPDSVSGQERVNVSVVVSGYYVPLPQPCDEGFRNCD